MATTMRQDLAFALILDGNLLDVAANPAQIVVFFIAKTAERWINRIKHLLKRLIGRKQAFAAYPLHYWHENGNGTYYRAVA